MAEPPEPRGMRGLTPTVGRSFLLAALLALSVGFASAKTRPTEIQNKDSPSQQYVSVNQLLTPAKAQRATERARRDFIQGRLDSALRETERALEIYPRCAAALSIQGAVSLSRTNFIDASLRFQQAIDAEPAFGPAYLGLGMAYTSQGRFKEALIPLDRAASFLPSSWRSSILNRQLLIWVSENPRQLSRRFPMRSDSQGPIRRKGPEYLICAEW